jgi:predicted transcriptional regulator YdeE
MQIMKRINNIFENIISLENLRLADEMARRGKKSTYGVCLHDKNRERNILILHQTQADWTPDATPSLWKEIEEPSEEYPVFVHPTGAHDVYHLGDIVWYPTLNSTLYRSKINNNSWSPDEYAQGWEVYNP